MCRLCNMQADPGKTARHESESERDSAGRGREERIVQTNAAIANQRALEVGFTAYGEDNRACNSVGSWRWVIPTRRRYGTSVQSP